VKISGHFLTYNEELIADAELKAIQEVQLYLRKRYDLLQLFDYFSDYISGTTYNTGSTVWFTITGNTQYLYSPTGTTTSNPLTKYWNRNDPRYPLIVDWVSPISLYKLHTRIAPQDVPKQRSDQYVNCIAMLKMIRDEKVGVDFPEIVNRVKNIYITGSTTQGSYLW
jgi:hypothetical protein